jgi:hypothetical protein
MTPTTTSPIWTGSEAAWMEREPEGSLVSLYDHALETVEVYARENPWQFGLAMLGLGFMLGWKLKFW